MTHSILLLIVDVLAVFRLTRLVIADTILNGARDRLIGRTFAGPRDRMGGREQVAARPRIAEFLSCPWCVSMWAAIVIVAGQALIPAVWFYLTVILAFSAVTGMLFERL